MKTEETKFVNRMTVLTELYITALWKTKNCELKKVVYKEEFLRVNCHPNDWVCVDFEFNFSSNMHDEITTKKRLENSIRCAIAGSFEIIN